MTEMLFDTGAMIREGHKMRGFCREIDPVARSYGQVPGGLPPRIAGDVKAQCSRLEAGVRALAERVEGLGAFSVALGERVQAADAEGGSERAERLVRMALLNLPALQVGGVGRRGLGDLQRLWPDVFDSIDDVKAARAADDLMRSLDARGLKDLDALAAFGRAHPGAPVPARLKSIQRTLQGTSRIAGWINRAGLAGSALSRALRDLSRSDLSLATRLLRAAQASATDAAAGAAAGGAGRLIASRLTRMGLRFGRGPVGWGMTAISIVTSSLGADKLGKALSGEFLFGGKPDPNRGTYEQLPDAQRRRIEQAVHGIPAFHAWEDASIFPPGTPVKPLLDRYQALSDRVDEQAKVLSEKDPVAPVHYRRRLDDLTRTIDERAALATRLDAMFAD